MEEQDFNKKLIEALDIPACSLIWLSCIEDTRTMNEIKQLWEIEDKYTLYQELEILREVKLVEAEKDIMTAKRIPSWNVRSHSSWLAGLSLIKFIPQFDPMLKGIYDPTFYFQLLTFWFFEKSPEDRLKILNSNFFKKVIMKTERIIHINKNMKDTGLFAYQESNVKNILSKYYTQKKLDKELNIFLKNKIVDGRIVIWYCLALMAITKGVTSDKRFKDFIKKNKNSPVEFMGAKLNTNMSGMYEEVEDILKEIKEKDYEIPKEVTALTTEKLEDYMVKIYRGHFSNSNKNFRRKLAKALLK